METNLLDERARFVRDFESGHWSMTELCERYGVSRPTGYKWMARLGRAARASPTAATPRIGVPTGRARRPGGADRRGAPGVRLGRQEAPAGAPHPVPGSALAGAQHLQ